MPVSTVEPIYTIALASILLHDSLVPIQLVGGALIIGGVLLAESGQGTEPAPADELAPSLRASATLPADGAG